MQLHQLKYFVAVVKTGSITKAAEQCFISQPSISQQLAKLEESIGRKLFSRVKGKLILTDPGQIFYEQACNILKNVEDAKRRVSDFDSSSGGSVNIGILPTLAPFILPTTLMALSKNFPEAVVTVREEISEALIAAAICGEIDILVEALPFDETCLNVEPLFSDTFYLAVNRNSPLAGMELVSLDTLGDMPFILLENIHCLTRQIEQYCFNERFMPKVVFQVSQLSTIKLLIELDYGVSILPAIAIDKDPGSCIRYINLDSKGEPPAREIVLAIRKDRYLSPAAKYFIAVMKEQYQKTC